MGCDIHLYVEQKQADGSWKTLAPPERDAVRWPRVRREGDGWVSPLWGPLGCMVEDRKCYGADGNATTCTGAACAACFGTGRSIKWYRNRNYYAFAILADVRNYDGGFKAIAEARGVPPDSSVPSPSWDHSESWLLLSELLAFDWAQTVELDGVVPVFAEKRWPEDDSLQEMRAYRREQPTSYCGMVGGGGSATVPLALAERLLAGDAKPEAGVKYYTRVTWTNTYREAAADFCAFVEAFLVPLGDPDSIRITFGFDS